MFLKPASKRLHGSNSSDPSTPQTGAVAARRFSVRSTVPIQAARDKNNSSNDVFVTPKAPSVQGRYSLYIPKSSRSQGMPLSGASAETARKCRSSVYGNSSIAEMEREMRRLVSERSTMLKSADLKDSELSKATSKLQVCLQAKTHMQSSLARIEREVKDLRKSNAILKTKVNTLETTGLKKKDIQVELAHARGALVAKEHDLADAKAQVQEVQQKLIKYTKNFKKQEEELKQLKTRLSSDIRSLRFETQLCELASSASAASNEQDKMELLEQTTSALLGLISELKDLSGGDQTGTKFDELKSLISVVLKDVGQMQSALLLSEDNVARLQSDCEDKDLMIDFLTTKFGTKDFTSSGCGSVAGTECSAVSQEEAADGAAERLVQQWVDHQIASATLSPHGELPTEVNEAIQHEHSARASSSEGDAGKSLQNEMLEELRLNDQKQTELVNLLELKVQNLESDCDYYYQIGSSSSEELQKVKADCDEKASIIASLLKKLEQYHGECDATTEAAQNLEEYIRRVQTENESLSCFISELKHQMEDGRMLVAEQEASIDELKLKLDQMLQENIDKHAYIEDLEEKVQSLEAKEQSLREELSSKASIIVDTEEKIDCLEAECATKNGLIAALEEELKESREEAQRSTCEAAKLAERIDDIVKERDDNVSALQAITEELLHARLHSSGTELENEKLQQDVNKLTVELGLSLSQVDKLDSDILVLKNEIEAKCLALVEKGEELNTLKGTAKEDAEIISHLHENIQSLKGAAEAKDDSIAILDWEVASLQDEHNKQCCIIEEKERELEEVKCDYSNQTVMVQEVRALADKLAEEVEAKACSIATLKEDQQNLHRTYEESVCLLEKSRNEATCLRIECDSKTSLLDSLEKQIAEAHVELDAALENRHHLEECLLESQQLVAQKTGMVDDLLMKLTNATDATSLQANAIEQLGAEHERSIKLVQDYEDRLETLKNEYETSKTGLENVRQHLADIQNDLNQQLTEQKAELQQKSVELVELRCTYQSIQVERDSLFGTIARMEEIALEEQARHTCEISNLQSEITSRETLVEGIKAQMVTLESDLNMQLTNNSVELQRITAELKAIRSEYDVLKVERDRFSSSLLEKELLLEEIEVKHCAVVEGMNDIVEKLKEENAIKTSTIEQLSCIEKQLADKDDILTATYSKLRDLEDEMLEKHAVMEQTAAANIKFEHTLSEKINETNSLHSAICELKYELESRDQLKEKLASHVEVLQRTLDEKEGQIVARDTDICLMQDQLSVEGQQAAEALAEKDRNFAEKSAQEAVLRKNILDLESSVERERHRYQTLERAHQAVKVKLMEREDFGQQEQAVLKAELAKLVECSQEMQMLNRNLAQENGVLRQRMNQVEMNLSRYRAQAEWYANRERDFAHELSVCEQRVEGSHAELVRWKTLYEDLQLKVEPFQEQLDMFQAEKRALLNQNSEALGEVQKLGQQYALLLGHQNQRQKIHHVLKLKEENIEVKKENAKLREQVLKHQQKIRRLDEQMAASGRRKRFDPSEAFVHDKENTPVRDVSNSLR